MKTVLRAIALIAVAGSTLSAQPWSGSFTKQSPAAGEFFGVLGVGPYDGKLTVPGAVPLNVAADITTANTGFSFWCVDGAGVFQGDTGVKLFTIASIGDAALKTKLAKAAYVTTLYSGTETAADMSNYNFAIWNIMGATPAGKLPGSATTVTNYVNAANANYGLLDLGSFYYVQFDDANLYHQGGAQELIFRGAGSPFIVPEPGSVALVAAGLAGLAIMRRRRGVSA